MTDKGEVFSWGNNDSGQLGREGNDLQPRKIDLKIPVDIITAGETHSVAANSQLGEAYFIGKLKSQDGNLIRKSEPTLIDYFYFRKNGISEIKSGMNHILIRS